MRNKRYTVTDGKIVLTLEEVAEGGFVVTSPIDPGLITEAQTITQAFVNARDAMKELRAARRKLRRLWHGYGDSHTRVFQPNTKHG